MVLYLVKIIYKNTTKEKIIIKQGIIVDFFFVQIVFAFVGNLMKINLSNVIETIN